jgi:hypothetical protein
MTSSGIEAATFRFVAKPLNQLRYSVSLMMDHYVKNLLHLYKILSSLNVRTCAKMRHVEGGREFASVFSERKEFIDKKKK